MSEMIKRLEPDVSFGGEGDAPCGAMEEDKYGRYVTYKDYEKLQQRIAELESAAKSVLMNSYRHDSYKFLCIVHVKKLERLERALEGSTSVRSTTDDRK